MQGQLNAAFGALEAELARQPLLCTSAGMDQAGVTCAIVWYFVHEMQPELADAAKYPALHAHSERAEQLPSFRNAPHGDGIVAC